MVEEDEPDDRVLEETAEAGLTRLQRGAHLLPIEGDFDVVDELASLERLDDVPERLGYLRARKGLIIGVRGEEDDRDLVVAPDSFGGVYAVNLSGQPDIHEYEIRDDRLEQLERLFTALRDAVDGIAVQLEPHLNAVRDNELVFYDEYVTGLLVHFARLPL